MIVDYKGYEINCTREECLAGYELVYYSVYRISDGLEVICNYSDSEDTIRTFVRCMKSRVDKFIESKGASELLEDEY